MKDDIVKIVNEFNQLKSNIDRITTMTEFNKNFFILNFYKILKSRSEFEFESSQEFALLTDKNKIYYALRAIDDDLFALFEISIHLFAIEAKIRETMLGKIKKTHVGIDYEFNNGKIALMQMSLESIRSSIIWLLDPKDLSRAHKNLLIDKILINKRVYKIMHGAESLDLPYTYGELLDGDRQKIIQFTKKYVDTRFLCEYVRISLNEGKHCSLYEALQYFGTITDEKKEELKLIHEKMGPIQYIRWNVHNMTGSTLRYAIFDVLYLQQFLFDIYKKIYRDTRHQVETYRYIVSMIRFVMLERRGIISILDDAKKVTDPLNNHMLTKNGQKVKMIKLFEELMENIVSYDTTIDINLLIGFNYFKKSMLPLLKLITYDVLIKKYTGHSSINLDVPVQQIKKLGFDRIVKLIEIYTTDITTIL
jgi:hypothetical protein